MSPIATKKSKSKSSSSKSKSRSSAGAPTKTSGKKQRYLAVGTARIFEVVADSKDVTTLKQVDVITPSPSELRGPQLAGDLAGAKPPGSDHGEVTVPTEALSEESDSVWRPVD